ncbi:MAG: hypothetical protein IKS43_01010 [Clostridia bacterium]|nr:hypothetical protein [Clostridia bacterium]
MTDLFLKVLGMSTAGAVLICAVLAVRLLIMGAPKWTRMLLWALVAIRLAVPFSPRAQFSLMPSIDGVVSSAAQTVSAIFPADPAAAPDTQTDAALQAEVGAARKNSAPAGSAVLRSAAMVWAAGAAGMLAYACAKYFGLKRRVASAVRVSRSVYEADGVKTPFVLGFFMPRIYVPFGLDGRYRELVLLHEQTHISGLDHLTLTLGWLLLCVHWFNPLAWAAYRLFSLDVELCCDESVIKDFGAEELAEYSQALLDSSKCGTGFSAFPLTFGGSGVKSRIKNVLNYKKPALWGTVGAVLAAAMLTGCLMTSPLDAAAADPLRGSRLISEEEARLIADENGWVVVPNDYSYRIAAGEELWRGFLKAVEAGEPCEVTLVTERVNPLEAKYSGLERPSAGLPVLIRKLEYDGAGFILRESSVYPEVFESKREFAFFGSCDYPGGECESFCLSDEPLKPLPARQEHVLSYSGDGFMLFALMKDVSRWE